MPSHPKIFQYLFLQIRTLYCYHQVLPFIKRVYIQITFSCHVSNWNSSWAFSWFSWQFLNILGQLFYRTCPHLVLSDSFSCLDSGLGYLKMIDAFFTASPVVIVFDLSKLMVSYTLIPWLNFCLLDLSIIKFFFLWNYYFSFVFVINKYLDLKEVFWDSINTLFLLKLLSSAFSTCCCFLARLILFW